MRVLNCYIESFGKLNEQAFEFDNLTILRENGFGKTTLAYFIKVMFYGFYADSVKKIKAENNDRKKYLPWGRNKSFGGNLVFETEEGHYKIERFFGETKSEDTFRLLDLKTNEDSEKYTCNIGEEIFGVNCEAFEQILFMDNKFIEITANESLSKKLNNMVNDINEKVNFENAIEILEKNKKKLKLQSGNGLIDEKIERLKVLLKRIETIEQNKKISENYKSELVQNEKQITNLQQKLALVERELKEIGSIEDKKALQKFQLSLSAEIENIERELKDMQEFFRVEYNQIKHKEIENSVDKLKEVDNAIKDKNVHVSYFLFFTQIVFISLSLGGFLTSLILKIFDFKNISLAFLIVGCVFFLLEIILYLLKFSKKSTEKQANTSLDTDTLHNNIRKYLSDYFLNIDSFETCLHTIQNNFERLTKLNQEFLQKQNQLKEINKVCLQNFSYTEESFLSLQNEQTILKDNLELAQKANNKYKTHIDLLESEIGELQSVLQQKEQLKEEISILKIKHQNLEKAIKFLKTAKSNLDTKFLPVLKKNFEKLNNLLIKEENNKIYISPNLNVEIEQMGANRKLYFFSDGYKTLLNLQLRLALISTIFKREKPFIILDDAFSNLDNDNFELVKAVIKKINRQDLQVIYLTCHNSRII